MKDISFIFVVQSKKMSLKKFLLLFSILYFISFSAQKDDYQFNDFAQRLKLMQKLLKSDPEKGITVLEVLLKEAKNKKYEGFELKLLANKCWYYLKKSDLNQVKITANLLEKKSEEYGNPVFLAKAGVYKCQALLDSELYDDALEEHQKVLSILDKIPQQNQEVLETRANAYIYISNLYYRKKDFKTAINKLLLADNSYNKIEDAEKGKSLQYLNFANIGTVYSDINSDSAQYYIHKSLEMNPDIKSPNFTQFLNYSILGDISLKKNQAQKSLENYLIAESLYPETGDLVNLEALYKGIISAYQKLGNQSKIKDYQEKLNKTQLKLYQHKYKSVHEILKESKAKEKEQNKLFYWMVGFFGLVIGILVFLFFKQKKKTPKRNINTTNLIELIKSNDIGFLFSFEQEFPEFFKKLLQLAPDLSKTEQEYCAFVKLNLSTKEIAKYKSVNPKSVQNNKYRIRKKLQIPTEIDIYDWMNDF